MKVIICISVLSHSSISGGGEKVGKREAGFHPGLKHTLTSLVILIYVTAPVAAVSGLLVLLETSHTVEKQNIHYALSRNGNFLDEYVPIRLKRNWNVKVFEWTFFTSLIHFPLFLGDEVKKWREASLALSIRFKQTALLWVNPAGENMFLTVKTWNMTSVH